MNTPVGPRGPYTPIVRAGPWLICSGQLGLAPPPPGTPGSGPPADAAPVLVDGGAPAQLSQALANARQLLDDHGATPEDVVKTTVFVTDPGQFPAVNEAYVAFFGDHRPARSMVAVSALPAGAAVEVEVWAYRERGDAAG
jgi:2-iminobutanoate/2-iminopropanoate deaminase